MEATSTRISSDHIDLDQEARQGALGDDVPALPGVEHLVMLVSCAVANFRHRVEGAHDIGDLEVGGHHVAVLLEELDRRLAMAFDAIASSSDKVPDLAAGWSSDANGPRDVLRPHDVCDRPGIGRHVNLDLLLKIHDHLVVVLVVVLEGHDVLVGVRRRR